MAVLQSHEWPGNVRQLRNLMEQLVLFASGDEIVLEDLPSEYRVPETTALSVDNTVWRPRPMADIEREAILRTLDHTGGHRDRVDRRGQPGSEQHRSGSGGGEQQYE